MEAEAAVSDEADEAVEAFEVAVVEPETDGIAARRAPHDRSVW